MNIENQIKKIKRKKKKKKSNNISDMKKLFDDTSISPKIKHENVVIKIRTQSFDELNKNKKVET